MRGSLTPRRLLATLAVLVVLIWSAVLIVAFQGLGPT